MASFTLRVHDEGRSFDDYAYFRTLHSDAGNQGYLRFKLVLVVQDPKDFNYVLETWEEAE